MKLIRLATALAVLAALLTLGAPSAASEVGGGSPGSISGVVTAADGAPIGNICVQAHDPENPDLFHDVGIARTGPDGTYTIGDLPGGAYLIEFASCGFGNNFAQEFYDDQAHASLADLVAVEAGADTAGIDAQLDAGGTVTGTVTGPDGAPAPRVCVEVWDGWDVRGFGITRSDGTYTVAGLRTLHSGPGFELGYQVVFSECDPLRELATEWYDDQPQQDSATPVPVTAGETTAGIDAQLAAAGHIAGTVTGADGSPLADACVETQAADGAITADAPTAADGTYRVAVPAGTYYVRFAPGCSDAPIAGGLSGEWYADAHDRASRQTVSVTDAATTTGIDAQLDLPGAITGTVTGPDGAPAAGVVVEAYDAAGDTVDSTETDDEGVYLLPVPPGTYTIWFTGGTDYRDEFYDDAPDATSATPVPVITGATTTGIDAELASLGGITGTVTGPNGQPAVDVCVSAGGPVDSGSSRTGADGTYTIAGLSAGDYRVAFRDCGSADLLAEWYDDQPTAATAATVTVTTGGTTAGIDAQLAHGGAITGRVTGSGYICIEAFDSDAVARARTTTFDGNYTLHSLPAGAYKLRFTRACSFTGGPDSPASQWYAGRLSFDDADPVDVAAASITTGIDYEFVDGAISGTITGVDGARLGQVCVTVRQTTGTGSRSTQSRATTVGPDNYRIGGLPAGDYRIELRDCGGRGLATEWYDDRPTMRSAVVVALTASAPAATAIDAQLEPPPSCPPRRPVCRPTPGPG